MHCLIPGPGYNTLFLQYFPIYLCSACQRRKFNTLSGLLRRGCTANLHYPIKLCVLRREAFCTICMMVPRPTRMGG